MLYHDRHIRLDHARIVRINRDGTRIVEIVEALMFGASGSHGDAVGTDGLAVREKNRDFYMRILVRRIEEAHRLVTRELWLRPMTPAWDIAFGDGPPLATDRFCHGDPYLGKILPRDILSRQSLRLAQARGHSNATFVGPWGKALSWQRQGLGGCHGARRCPSSARAWAGAMKKGTVQGKKKVEIVVE
jgi:hypothetical protein